MDKTSSHSRGVVHDLFAADGLLAHQVEDYSPRDGQIDMSQAVLDAITDQQHLVVEAGTGTGKTFAYLLPVLMAGKKAVISTGTRNLQDQLFHRDLPTVAAACGQPCKVTLLKGRSNYLCLYRLQMAGVQANTRAAAKSLRDIMTWSKQTNSGDTAELTSVPEGDPIWPHVTSTPDNCLGQECPAFNDCHVVKARRAAQAADVVVVNHHLLLADMRLKEEGFGELLPGLEVVILDEAHQFPETAASFFGQRVSSRQITGITRDSLGECAQAGVERDGVESAVSRVKVAAADVRQSLASGGGAADRQNLAQASSTTLEAIAMLATALHALADELKHFDGHTSGIDTCRRRALDAAYAAERMLGGDEDEAVAWIEVSRTGFQLHRSPLDVSKQLRKTIGENQATWIFTSATLAIGADFSHFSERVGLDEPRALKVESTFDYPNNALLYVPEGFPPPSERDYTDRVVAAGMELLSVCNGGAFFLFTSYRALNRAKQLIEKDRRFSRNLLVQRDQPRDELLRQFREDGQAVLLGTSSFWEGVDVRGAALSLVVIDKLPFASPGDPLMQARLEAIKKRGQNPFMTYQLPLAVLSLKQGVGRLIRGAKDKGVCMICDPRLYGKPYGRQFLNSLPPMRVERDAAPVKKFLQSIESSTAENDVDKLALDDNKRAGV